MSLLTSQILKFADSFKTQKCKYLENETYFLQIKKNHSLYIKCCNMSKNKFLAEVIFMRNLR